MHDDSVLHPRPLHAAWGRARLTLRHDHPFWQTHYPPNGWGCQCRVTPVAAPAANDQTAPPEAWDVRDSKGKLPGIDEGFDYAPGANTARPWVDIIGDKLLNLEAPIGAAMWQALRPVLSVEMQVAFSAWVDEVLSSEVSMNRWQIVGSVRQNELDYLAAAGRPLPASAEIAIEDRLLVGKKARRHQEQGNALTADEWKSVPGGLEDQRKVYFDKQENKLLYVLPAINDERSIRLVVEVDFVTARPKRSINMARSGFKINVQALQDRTRYVEIK